MDQRTRLKAVLFDLDGTLVRLGVDWAALKKAVAEISNGTTTSFQEAYAAADQPTRQRLSDALEALEIEGAHASEVVDGANQVVTHLQKKYGVSVVPRNSRKSAEIALKKHVDSPLLVIGREDVQELKPHPEGLHTAMTHLGSHPEATILVGDTAHDVEAGHAAGMPVVVIKNPQLAYPPEGADFYIDDLHGLLALPALTEDNDG